MTSTQGTRAIGYLTGGPDQERPASRSWCPATVGCRLIAGWET